MSKKAPHPITKWRQRFLAKRDLIAPTGMPLYSYRVTKEEFDELERMLKEMLSALLEVAQLGTIAREVAFFPSLFVMYGAEWWRRRYDGSGWSWEPIVEDLGAPPDGWNQSQRSECVETGLREWRLRLSNLHGLRFLGSVAFQGGLPMQLLATARGNVGRVLTSVLGLAAGSNVEANDVVEWVRSLSGYLPRTYRQEEIYALLADVILTVLRLKQEACLTSSVGAIEALNQFESGWRSRFPIPVEDIQAQGLIEQLIQDAAAPRVVRRSLKIGVERSLELLDNGAWQVRSDVDLVEYIDAAELAALFSAEVTSMTRVLTLRFVRGKKVSEVGLRRLAGQDRYRIDRRPLTCDVPDALAEHSMALISSDGQTWNCAVPRGEELDPDLPWVFEPDDAFRLCRLVRQGSGSVKSMEACLLIPSDWKIHPDIDSAVQTIGSPALGRTAWKIKGNARALDPDDRQFRIRCGQADSREETYEWRGSRLWELSTRPELVFRGVPKLYRISEEGLTQPAGAISWRLSGAGTTRAPLGIAGPVDAVWPAEGETKWKSKVLLLPEDARYELSPGDSPTKGRIRFVNWGLVSAQIDSPSISTSIKRDGPELCIDLEYAGPGSPPEWCDFKLYWPKSPLSATARMPFPATGSRILDATGMVIPDGSLMTLSNTVGIRIVGFLSNVYQADLHLDLYRGSSGPPITSIRKPLKTNPGEHRIEVRVVDHQEDILRLLSDADSLDAVVSLRLQVGSDAAASLRIARYACELVKQPSSGTVAFPNQVLAQFSTDRLRAVPVYAVRIDSPDEEPTILAATEIAEEQSVCWTFPEQELDGGPWLIYPGREATVAFRPLLWTVEKPVMPSPETEDFRRGDLARALSTTETDRRNSQLDSAINALAGNYLHSEWLLVEHLAGHLGHLPPSTLDLWRRFARSPGGMTALALRMGNLTSGFVERFPNEMPFLWETISLRTWTGAMMSLKTQCESWYGSGAQQIVKAHLERRIQDMAASTPSLRILLECAKWISTGESTSDLEVSRKAFMASVFGEQLFDGPNCRLQQLLRNNSEATWPGGPASHFNIAKQDWRSAYLCPMTLGYRDASINTPILLALAAASDPSSDWQSEAGGITALRTFQRFDPEWFAEAFDLTVARCLATGIIRLP